MAEELRDEQKRWRALKSSAAKSEEIKLTVKKATTNVVLPPKKKHESNLIYWSIVGQRTFDESRNYEIVERLIKRSRKDNDVVSLKSLIVLHNVIMSPETRNIRYLGAYFHNFSYDSRFNNLGRPVLIRKFGHYIDMLGKSHVNCGLDIDIITPIKNNIKSLEIEKVVKCVCTLEKIIEEILNFDLPSVYCSNILIREVNRLLGFDLIMFLNNYMDAVLDIVDKVGSNEVGQKIYHMVDYYFQLSSKARILHDYLLKYMFNDTTSVPELKELDHYQRKKLDNLGKIQALQNSEAVASSSSKNTSTKVCEGKLIDFDPISNSVSEQHQLSWFDKAQD